MALKFPFRLRFWVRSVGAYRPLEVVRARTAGGARDWVYDIVDGPFDTQEDAVRALHFWKAQRTKRYGIEV